MEAQVEAQVKTRAQAQAWSLPYVTIAQRRGWPRQGRKQRKGLRTEVGSHSVDLVLATR